MYFCLNYVLQIQLILMLVPLLRTMLFCLCNSTKYCCVHVQVQHFLCGGNVWIRARHSILPLPALNAPRFAININAAVCWLVIARNTSVSATCVWRKSFPSGEIVCVPRKSIQSSLCNSNVVVYVFQWRHRDVSAEHRQLCHSVSAMCALHGVLRVQWRQFSTRGALRAPSTHSPPAVRMCVEFTSNAGNKHQRQKASRQKGAHI